MTVPHLDQRTPQRLSEVFEENGADHKRQREYLVPKTLVLILTINPLYPKVVSMRLHPWRHRMDLANSAPYHSTAFCFPVTAVSFYFYHIILLTTGMVFEDRNHMFSFLVFITVL